MTNKKVTNLAFAALFTAIISILSQISFLTPTVPVTLQIFGVSLCGFTMPIKWSFPSVLTYIAVGTLGLPVFSNFTGGFQITFGPTGGFIWGFIVLAAACSLAQKRKKNMVKIIIAFTGLLICHLIGIIQYSLLTGTTLWISLFTASLPFLIKDIVCLAAAFFVSKFIKKRIKGLNS